MIFLTVGTHEPFDRLVRAVDAWCGARRYEDIFAQITDPGPNGFRPRHMEWVATLSPDAYQERFETADLIVAHAGMGSIITALSLARPILIMPRQGDLRETRNDHQIATARKFATRDAVHVASDEGQLTVLLDRLTGEGMVAKSTAIDPYAQPQLIKALRSFITKEDGEE